MGGMVGRGSARAGDTALPVLSRASSLLPASIRLSSLYSDQLAPFQCSLSRLNAFLLPNHEFSHLKCQHRESRLRQSPTASFDLPGVISYKFFPLAVLMLVEGNLGPLARNSARFASAIRRPV